MSQIGKWNELKVLSIEDFGIYLDAGHLGKALYSPGREMDPPEVDEVVKVFLYHDKNNDLRATQAEVLVQLGEVAILKVVDINATGAFVDWGLPKNLMVPYAQQGAKMIKGLKYPIYCYQDKYDQRLLGSAKLNKHLKETNESLKPGQKVSLLICGKTGLGYKAVINNEYLGLVHNSDAYRKMTVGDVTDGFVKNIREDGKINLTMHVANKNSIDQLSDRILEDLTKHKSSNLTDKSSPQEIYEKWNVSKGSYKKALGKLYKERKIVLSPDQIKLAD